MEEETKPATNGAAWECSDGEILVWTPSLAPRVVVVVGLAAAAVVVVLPSSELPVLVLSSEKEAACACAR